MSTFGNAIEMPNFIADKKTLTSAKHKTNIPTNY